MSSEQISIGAYSPIITEISLSVIKHLKSNCISKEEKICIHSDLVPKVSERVLISSMKPRIVGNEETVFEYEVPKIKEPVKVRNPGMFVPQRQNQNTMHSPQRPPFAPSRPSQIANTQVQIPQTRENNFQMPPQRFAPHVTGTSSEIQGDYGKINALLSDPSVSTIECPGPGRPLFVSRMGQRQLTRISLSNNEINNVLKKFSETAHIPLLEGVFRASVENFVVNAVISEMIGHRFVIKKNTPYSLIE